MKRKSYSPKLLPILLFIIALLFSTGILSLTANAANTIAPSFTNQDLASLYKSDKLQMSNSNKLSAATSESPVGLLITGDSADLANTIFTFTDSFDFSDGIVGRLSLDAISAKSNNLSIESVKIVGNKAIVTAASKKTGTVQIIGICNGDLGLVTHTCTVTVNSATQPAPVVVALQPGDKLTQKNINYQVTSITQNGGTVKVTGISSKASFKNNKKLTKITLGANITTIPANTFYKCTALITICLGKNVKAINEGAFYGCTKLSRIVLYGNKLKTINKTAFQKTASAKNIYCKKTYTAYYKKLFTKAKFTGFKQFKMKLLK